MGLVCCVSAPVMFCVAYFGFGVVFPRSWLLFRCFAVAVSLLFACDYLLNLFLLLRGFAVLLVCYFGVCLGCLYLLFC